MNKKMLTLVGALILNCFAVIGCADVPEEESGNSDYQGSYHYVINSSNQSLFQLKGSCAGASQVKVGEPFNVSLGCSGNQFENEMDISQIADGSWETLILDTADRVLESRRTLKDSVMPSISYSFIPTQLSVSQNGAGAFGVSGSCSQEGEFVMFIYSTRASSTKCKNGSYTLTMNFLNLDLGAMDLVISHRDLAGNQVVLIHGLTLVQ